MYRFDLRGLSLQPASCHAGAMIAFARPQILRMLCLLLPLCLTSSAAGGVQLDADRVSQIRAWLPPQPSGVGRPISDRASWDRLSRHPSFHSVIPRAESMARDPVPALPDDLYLDYSRTGNRDRCQAVMFARVTV